MTTLEQFALDVDCRISSVWAELGDLETLTPTALATALVAAYSQGYADGIAPVDD